jgi:hypothetical protein
MNDDQCVYVNSVLGRMTSTFTSSYNADSQFSQSQPTSTPIHHSDSLINPGTVMILAAIVLLLLASLRNRKKVQPSKLE